MRSRFSQTGNKKVLKSSVNVYQSLKFPDDTWTNNGLGVVTNSTAQDTLRLIHQYLDAIKPDLVPGQQVEDVLLSEIRLRSVFYSSLSTALSELSVALKPLFNSSAAHSGTNQHVQIVEVAVPQSSLEVANSDPSLHSAMTMAVQKSLLAADEFLLSSIHIRSENYNSQGRLRESHIVLLIIRNSFNLFLSNYRLVQVYSEHLLSCDSFDGFEQRCGSF